MFGMTNRKQEMKDKEREVAVCRKALEQVTQMLGMMSMMWIDAEQRISDLERERRELDRQLKRVSSAVEGVSDKSNQQIEENQKLLLRAEEIAEKQRILREEQKQVQKESANVEAEKPISLAKVIAPVTAELSQGMEEMRNMLEDVVDLGKQMEILSLNAAVEAGRMGESGRKFVEAAEEVRGLSDKYQQTTGALAQHLQVIGLKWQKSKGEIEEVEGRLKQQYARLEVARNACSATGEEILNLPISELYDEMEKVFEDKAVEESCQNVSKQMDKAREDFTHQQETWDGLSQTVTQARELIKTIQEME